MSSLKYRWDELCRRFLPQIPANSIWRYNRDLRDTDLEQGWKFHISATILNACDILEKVAPFLTSMGIQFKAVSSLEELHKLNNGRYYGYSQVGKCITVYPTSVEQAISIGPRLADLTSKFKSPSIPFDRKYNDTSCVFYRYGSFRTIEIEGKKGAKILAVKDGAGEWVPDDRLQPVPNWVSDPFTKIESLDIRSEKVETPLTSKYLVFQALTQRGKGGAYLALDTTTNPPRISVIKEGRTLGEIGWTGVDGRKLVENEYHALTALKCTGVKAPTVLAYFEIEGNSYLAMEYIEGKSLENLMLHRRRRYSIRKVLELAIEVADIIGRINEAGWIWNDCKPANLIVTPDNSLRPIDFEGSFTIGNIDSFRWYTPEFSKRGESTRRDDSYSLGSIIYFLLTGKFYDLDLPVEIGKLRRGVPQPLIDIVRSLLSVDIKDEGRNIASVKGELQIILSDFNQSLAHSFKSENLASDFISSKSGSIIMNGKAG